jgi:hypothetical protein
VGSLSGSGELEPPPSRSPSVSHTSSPLSPESPSSARFSAGVTARCEHCAAECVINSELVREMLLAASERLGIVLQERDLEGRSFDTDMNRASMKVLVIALLSFFVLVTLRWTPEQHFPGGAAPGWMFNFTGSKKFQPA